MISKLFGQHKIQIEAQLNDVSKEISIRQIIIFQNHTNTSVNKIYLNDWNNAFAHVNTPLAKRFSDEFDRTFYLASALQRGYTLINSIKDNANNRLTVIKNDEIPDVFQVLLTNPLLPNQSITLHLDYLVKIPSNVFTKFGFDEKGNYYLKNWFLSPAKWGNNEFVVQNNFNLDDIANDAFDIDLIWKKTYPFHITTDLNLENENQTTSHFVGKNRTDFNFILNKSQKFEKYNIQNTFIETDLQVSGVNGISKAITISQIQQFVNELFGEFPFSNMTITQVDYDRNPFYGLNQLPGFLRPFTNDFIYEIQFLKNYSQYVIKNTLQLNPRSENWIYDALQMYIMIKYIRRYHPNVKFTGALSKIPLIKNYHLAEIQFNEQYNYFYMMMARKNLDQSLSTSKENLIKFNEKISNKCRAGLALMYLEDYLGEETLLESIRMFLKENQKNIHLTADDFLQHCKQNTDKNIDWFDKIMVKSNLAIDYKLVDVKKSKDSIYFQLKNKTAAQVPMPIFGLKSGQVVFKKWVEPNQNNQILNVPRAELDKLVINYENVVPEINLRNNWQSFKGFFPNNRPIKFILFEDIEDPTYNQLIYMPLMNYNFYDGITVGARLKNATLLDKPFEFELSPAFATKSKDISGSAYFGYNQYFKDQKLYNIKYATTFSYFHYAANATYLKFNPYVQFRFREMDLRENRKRFLTFRQVFLDKQINVNANPLDVNKYTVFNAKYLDSKQELAKQYNWSLDLQLSEHFGKVSYDTRFRKLFDNNRQLNFRLFSGVFLYHNKRESTFFDFALERPNDYLFDYNYLGRSEQKGFFSQQFILAEGGFKSKLSNPYANNWITSVNTTATIWRNFDVYADFAMYKNQKMPLKLVYDTGIRLNLLEDYFEIYFPINSTNGWEIGQKSYAEKIRFVITLSPKSLLNLFNRKWL